MVNKETLVIKELLVLLVYVVPVDPKDHEAQLAHEEPREMLVLM